ncbi:MAG: hypothetical protein LBU38_02285 [Propionibacteriaceae bacterium]|nr:hypothetical protein [Propionibacteriaceae bacterium]
MVFVEKGGTYVWETIQGATWNQWVAVGLLSLSFLALLIGLVVILRGIASYLEANGFLPNNPEDPKAKDSIGRTLSVTLLAFLGIYSVFGYIGQTASNVMMDATMFSSDWSDLVVQALVPQTLEDSLVVLAVILGAFLLRRVVDLIGRRTGKLWPGFFAAAVEAFYLLAFFIAGSHLLARVMNWARDREVADWARRLISWMSSPLRQFGLNVPDLLLGVWHWFWEIGWPVVITSFLQPMLWFALAALVIGTQIESFGELLRSVDSKTTAPRHKHLAKLASKLAGSERKREAAVQIQDAVFGDLDEKYLPIFQVLRLTWKAGVGFLGAFVAAFNLLECLANWADYALFSLYGPHLLPEQYVFDQVKQLALDVLFITLRLALLAVGYTIAFSAMTGITSGNQVKFSLPSVSNPTPATDDLDGNQLLADPSAAAEVHT